MPGYKYRAACSHLSMRNVLDFSIVLQWAYHLGGHPDQHLTRSRPVHLTESSRFILPDLGEVKNKFLLCLHGGKVFLFLFSLDFIEQNKT